MKITMRRTVMAGVSALALCLWTTLAVAEDEHDHDHDHHNQGAEKAPQQKPAAKESEHAPDRGAVHQAEGNHPQAQHHEDVRVELVDFREHEHHEHHEFHEFHERRVHLFDPFEMSLWAAGTWVEGWYNGQYGWWWVSNGRRYYYPHPIYPYPMEVSEVWYPETVIVAPPPPPPPPPPVAGYAPPPPQPGMWYYCDNPAGYYPYVQSCGQPFRAVQAQPR